MLIFLQGFLALLFLLFLMYRLKLNTLIIVFVMLFFYSNEIVYADNVKFDIGRSHHIRIAASLSNYEVGVKGARYTLVKYEDSEFTKPLSTYDFEPTILKEVHEAFTSDKGSTAYKGISPDIYEATPGYYEIYQVISADDGYYNPGKIRFKIDTKGVFEAINTSNFKQNFELNTGIMYDPAAQSYEPDGSVRKDYKDQRTYYYNFNVSTTNKLILHNRASSYNSDGLLPIGEEFFDTNNTAYFELFVLQEDTKEWVKIIYPNSLDIGNEEILGCFPVEIEKYGGGLRDNFGELINYFYKYNFDFGLTPNMSYKFVEKYVPINFKKNKNGEELPMFTFYIKTNDKSKIEYAKMDKETYDKYSVAYNYIFNKNKDNITRDLVVETKAYSNSVPGLNIDRRTNVSTIFVVNLDNKAVEETTSFSVSESVSNTISYEIPENVTIPPFVEDNMENVPMPKITVSRKSSVNEKPKASSEVTPGTTESTQKPTEQNGAGANTVENDIVASKNAPELNTEEAQLFSSDTPNTSIPPVTLAENNSSAIQQTNFGDSVLSESDLPIKNKSSNSSTATLLMLLFILFGLSYIVVYNNKKKARRKYRYNSLQSNSNTNLNSITRRAKNNYRR